jgi:hypothetical protein
MIASKVLLLTASEMNSTESTGVTQPSVMVNPVHHSIFLNRDEHGTFLEARALDEIYLEDEWPKVCGVHGGPDMNCDYADSG